MNEKIPLSLDAAPADNGTQKQPAPEKTPLLGWFAVGFGVLGVFALSIVFVPLALVLGIIALFVGQSGWGVAAIFLAIIGLLTSPVLLTLLGLGALLAWFGLPEMHSGGMMWISF